MVTLLIIYLYIKKVIKILFQQIKFYDSWRTSDDDDDNDDDVSVNYLKLFFNPIIIRIGCSGMDVSEFESLLFFFLRVLWEI